MTTKAQLEENRRHLQKLDHITFRVEKGKKEIMKAYAESVGMSLNAFVVEALEEKMKSK